MISQRCLFFFMMVTGRRWMGHRTLLGAMAYHSRIKNNISQRSRPNSFFMSRSHQRLSFVQEAACSKCPLNNRRGMTLLMSSPADVDVDEATENRTKDSVWNIPGLKKEVHRQVMRTHKKIGKTSQRLRQAREKVKELMNNEEATLEELDKCPNVEPLETELEELQNRLLRLNQVEESLQPVSKKSSILSSDVFDLVVELGLDDEPPKRPERGPGKKKGPREQTKSRLPYRRYFSFNNVEIRVGKKAEDNDELTLNPKYRDGSDWWMHASGCPGSHVVIRSSDNDLPKEVVQDAACLAARQSKCQGNVIKVSLTRCRDIKKPPGAKAGLVQLTGKVRTVSVNMKEAESRFERLEETCLIN